MVLGVCMAQGEGQSGPNSLHARAEGWDWEDIGVYGGGKAPSKSMPGSLKRPVPGDASGPSGGQPEEEKGEKEEEEEEE